jgi:hypothetical protein
MRGLGDFQRAQMKRGDQRIGQLFSHVRQALDLLEDIVFHPYEPPLSPPSAEQPRPVPVAPAVLDPERRAYRVKEVCKLFGLSHTTLWRAMREKKATASEGRQKHSYSRCRSPDMARKFTD